MDRRNFLTLGAPRSRASIRGEHLNAIGDTKQTPPTFLSRTSTGLEPYNGEWGYKQAAHLLRRCMVGPREPEIRQAIQDGLAGTLEKLFQPFNPGLKGIEDWAGNDPQIRTLPGQDPLELAQIYNQKKEALVKWWLEAVTISPVSLQERMTMFWHNHFTSEIQVVNFAEYMYNQNQLLRNNSLGNLKQFAYNVSIDMAMLIYLDGIKNYKNNRNDNINENYARELMELFTMGVIDWEGNPNYTQEEVSEVARALSGWTATPSSQGTSYLGQTSQFVQTNWDPGQKTIFGKTGAWKLQDVIDLIFSERADQTAKFVCEKLYRAFIYDIADRTVVEQMALTLRNNNWEVKPVIEQLLRSAHFFDETNIGALDKGQIDVFLGMIRMFDLQEVPDFTPGTRGNGRDLFNRLNALGHLLFSPPNVKGWPGGRTWISTSTLPQRQKFGIDVANENLGSRGTIYYRFNPVAFAKQFPDTENLDILTVDMARCLLNMEPSDRETQILYDTILDNGKPYEWNIDDPDQKPDERIRKFLEAAFQLAKFQLY